MDSVLKFVFDHWYTQNNKLHNIPNGIHPLLVSELTNRLKTSDLSYHSAMLKLENDDIKPSFNVASLSGHIKNISPNNIIHSDQLDFDSTDIYMYLIEVRYTFHALYETSSFILNETKYEYSLVDTIPKKTLNLIRNGKVKLLIEYGHDPILNSEWVNLFEKYIISAGIDPANVIIISGNDYASEYKKHFPNSRIRLTTADLLITHQYATTAGSYPKQSDLGYVSDIVREYDLDTTVYRPNKFLSFNRTMKSHRYILAYYALKYNLLNDGIFSFINDHGHLTDHIKHLMTALINEDDIDFYLDQIKSLIPYEIDTHHLLKNEKQHFDTANTSKEWYTNTYVHITTETGFTEEIIFFSEKTWKPILNLQPFVYVGNYGALNKLRNLGFKTFHPYIDESYDNETNHGKRMIMIRDEILKLKNKSIEELHSWYYSITDMLIHNQKLFMTYQNIDPYGRAFDDIINFYKSDK